VAPEKMEWSREEFQHTFPFELLRTILPQYPACEGFLPELNRTSIGHMNRQTFYAAVEREERRVTVFSLALPPP